MDFSPVGTTDHLRNFLIQLISLLNLVLLYINLWEAHLIFQIVSNKLEPLRVILVIGNDLFLYKQLAYIISLFDRVCHLRVCVPPATLLN